MIQPRKEKVLILRLWYEPREIADAAPVLRGTLVDVDSGAQQSVASVDDITQAIERRLGELLRKGP